MKLASALAEPRHILQMPYIAYPRPVLPFGQERRAALGSTVGARYAHPINSHTSDEGWERAFSLVFERSSNGIALVDEQRRFIEVNNALLSILGRTRDEILGTSGVDVIPPSQRLRAEREWDMFLRTGEYSTSGPIVRPDGSDLDIEIAARLATVRGRRLAIYIVTSPLGSWSVRKTNGSRGRTLTKREQEIVTLIALGRETPEIAKELYIAEATVRTHVKNAMSKLGARTRAQLVAIALSRVDTLRLPPTGE